MLLDILTNLFYAGLLVLLLHTAFWLGEVFSRLLYVVSVSLIVVWLVVSTAPGIFTSVVADYPATRPWVECAQLPLRCALDLYARRWMNASVV